MRSVPTFRRAVLGAVLAAAVVTTSGCGSPKQAAGDDSSIHIGVVYSQSGPLASYGAQYAEGFGRGGSRTRTS